MCAYVFACVCVVFSHTSRPTKCKTRTHQKVESEFCLIICFWWGGQNPACLLPLITPNSNTYIAMFFPHFPFKSYVFIGTPESWIFRKQDGPSLPASSLGTCPRGLVLTASATKRKPAYIFRFEISFIDMDFSRLLLFIYGSPGLFTWKPQECIRLGKKSSQSFRQRLLFQNTDSQKPSHLPNLATTDNRYSKAHSTPYLCQVDV